MVFDNSKGPINIYCLNYNAKSSDLRGGHATQSFTENSANRVSDVCFPLREIWTYCQTPTTMKSDYGHL